MATTVYPLPMDEILAREVVRAARATGLTRAELTGRPSRSACPRLLKRFASHPDELLQSIRFRRSKPARSTGRRMTINRRSVG